MCSKLSLVSAKNRWFRPIRPVMNPLRFAVVSPNVGRLGRRPFEVGHGSLSPLDQRLLWYLVFLVLVAAIVVIISPPNEQPNSSTTSVRTFQLGLGNTTWAGYEIAPMPGYRATFVNASWTNPQVVCSEEENSSALIWVGLGGQSYNTSEGVMVNGLEQIGTRIDCQNGAVTYSTWYELWPLQPATRLLPNVVQKAGDKITASVSYSDLTGEFTLGLTSSSAPNAQPFAVSWANGSLVSAEWIVEAPGFNYAQPRHIMVNFGSVTFRNCFATVGNHTDSITGFGDRPYSSLNELSYVCLNSTSLKAVPQKIVNNGEDFAVTWQNGGSC